MGQCLAPCIKEVSKDTYREMTDEIARFLNGGYKEIKEKLTEKMKEASENLEFERAKEFRDQLFHIEATMEKQKMTLLILPTGMCLVIPWIKAGCVYRYFLSDKENSLREMFPYFLFIMNQRKNFLLI